MIKPVRKKVREGWGKAFRSMHERKEDVLLLDDSYKTGWIVLDQIRTVDKKRLTKRRGMIDKKAVEKLSP